MSDSPVKKLDFQSVGKENALASLKPVGATTTKPVEKALEASKVALGIKEAEANEPLLQENPHRFVLFPIKYHEVSHVADASTRKVVWTCRTRPSAPPQFAMNHVLTISFLSSTDLANVQEGRGLFLDR